MLSTYCDGRGMITCSREKTGPFGDCKKGKLKYENDEMSKVSSVSC